MSRFLWLIILVVAYILWRILGRKPADPDFGWRKFSRVHQKQQRFAQRQSMVKDPICGAYLPKDRAVERDGEYFCSEECASQWDHKTKTS